MTYPEKIEVLARAVKGIIDWICNANPICRKCPLYGSGACTEAVDEIAEDREVPNSKPEVKRHV